MEADWELQLRNYQNIILYPGFSWLALSSWLYSITELRIISRLYIYEKYIQLLEKYIGSICDPQVMALFPGFTQALEVLYSLLQEEIEHFPVQIASL